MKAERSYSIIYNPKSSPKKSKHAQFVLKLSYLQVVTSSYVYKLYLSSSLITTENYTEDDGIHCENQILYKRMT